MSTYLHGGRKWEQQEKHPFHGGNAWYRKWHLNSGSGVLLSTLKVRFEGSKPFAKRISPLDTSLHLLSLPKANAKCLNYLNSHSGVGPCSCKSCVILNTGGAFHPAFSKDIYYKRFQAKKEHKQKRKAEKNSFLPYRQSG